MRRALTAILAVTLSIAAHAQSANEQLIYSFCAQTNCADGAFPNSGMALLSNGSFVAATPGGGDVYPNGSSLCSRPPVRATTIPLMYLRGSVMARRRHALVDSLPPALRLRA